MVISLNHFYLWKEMIMYCTYYMGIFKSNTYITHQSEVLCILNAPFYATTHDSDI